MNKPPIVLNVLPRGSRLLDILVELGHINEPLLHRINMQLLRLPTVDGKVELDDVRRVAAQTLFDVHHELPPHVQRTLDKEWTTLFS